MTGQVAEYFRQGGIFMWPLLFFSLLALTVIIERFIVLTKARINVNEFLTKIRKALLVNRNVKEAIKVCEDYRGPVPSILKAGLLKYGQPKEDVEKTIENETMSTPGCAAMAAPTPFPSPLTRLNTPAGTPARLVSHQYGPAAPMGNAAKEYSRCIGPSENLHGFAPICVPGGKTLRSVARRHHDLENRRHLC